MAGPGRPSRPARITWAGRPVPSRHAALPGWSGPLTGSGSEGPRWGGRAMAVAAAAPLPCPLLLAVCWVLAAPTAAGRSGQGGGDGAAELGSGCGLRSAGAVPALERPLRALLVRGSGSAVAPRTRGHGCKGNAGMDVREILSFCGSNSPKLVSRVRSSAGCAPCPAAYRERGC